MPLTDAQRTKAKNLWVDAVLPEAIARDIDRSNLNKKHPILIENCLHPKVDKIKTLVCEHGNWENNVMPESVLKEAQTIKEFVKKYDTAAPKQCLLLEWACQNALPVSNRNANLVPNIVAWTQDKNTWQACADIQGKELLEFENWAARDPPTTFNCKQLQAYAGTVGKRSICDLCLIGGKE